MAPQDRKKKDDDNEEEDDSKIFPQRLMEILADPRSQESICWLPHGRAFIVRKRDLFAEEVMPRYFSRKAKYSSFTRKLNRWNFVRVSSGPELGAYYHEFFLRDRPHLAAQMFCKNARTVLAMASDHNNECLTSALPASDPKSAPHLSAQALPQAAAVAAPSACSPNNNSLFPPITPALLAALMKSPALENEKIASLTPNNALIPCSNVQLLEMHIRQQEQANRILLEHAMALSIQQRQEQQAKLAAEQSRLVQMRQLMQLRLQQQQDRNPSNPRASAA